MPIKITLIDSEALEVDIKLEDWNRAFQTAIQSDAMIEIENPDGRILSINPHSVLFLEAIPSRQEAGAPAAV